MVVDSSKVILPHGQLAAGKIADYPATGMRRVHMAFGIGCQGDLQKPRHVLAYLVTAHQRVLAEPAPAIRVLELAGSSVNFAVRPFGRVEDYWELYFDLTEHVKLRFDEEGISIPFPQQDVHVLQANGSAQKAGAGGKQLGSTGRQSRLVTC